MQQPSVQFATELAKLLQPLEQSIAQLHTKPLKLIIHAGTPKTGTTSLQAYLDKRQRKLRGKGVLYPHNLEGLLNPTAPKHQWFEKNLLSTHLAFFIENFNNIVAQVKDDTHTVILSSEGIYNHWWDFSDESKYLLSELRKLFDVEIWVWFREPLGFIESYYKQCIRNPQIEHNPCYGKDLSFAQMLEIPWFARHLDYQGFVTDCCDVFGEDKVVVFEYGADVVQEVIGKLGLATPHDNATPRKNSSLNSASAELLRVINGFDVSAKDKELLMPHLKEVDKLLCKYAANSLIDEQSKQVVLELFKPVQR